MSMSSIKLLIINPNTTSTLTSSLKESITQLLAYYPDVSCDYFTAPSSPPHLHPHRDPAHSDSESHPLNNDSDTPSYPHPGALPSINSPSDAQKSAEYCFDYLKPMISSESYDGFLVACYSEHPLVGMIGREIERIEGQSRSAAKGQGQGQGEGGSRGRRRRRRKHVIGIFEASIITSLGLLSQYQYRHHDFSSSSSSPKPEPEPTFGIVSTGKIWEESLSNAVHTFLGLGTTPTTTSRRFAGVETTGLTATQLHALPPHIVQSKISAAAARLVSSSSSPTPFCFPPPTTPQETPKPNPNPNPKRVKIICLGCAGMTNLKESIRKGVVDALGNEEGESIWIVDGVLEGVKWLVGVCRMGV